MPTRRPPPVDPVHSQGVELGELNRGIKDLIHLVSNDMQARSALTAKALAPKEAEVPPLIKWLVGAVATLGATALIGLGIWLVTSVSQMSETLARMDERMKGNDTSVQAEMNELRRRITAVELRDQEGDR
jgi:hypothetical protein